MIDASNVNTCRLDIFSCDVKGFRRPESGKPSRPALKPPSPPHHESASRILAEYGYWLYTFTWNATVRLFYSSPFPCLILLCCVSLGAGHRRSFARAHVLLPLAGVKNAETEKGWKGKGRNPLSRQRLLSHGKIFALLSISSSGKLKFSVTPDPRLPGKNSND